MEDYETMYSLCTPASREAYPYEEFYRIYTEIAQVATIISVDPGIKSVLEEENAARAQFSAAFDTSFVGPFYDENVLDLEWIGDRWAVNWSKRTVFSQLAEDNRVYMQPQPTTRANIYDVHGKGLAVEGAKVTVGVVPGMIVDEPAVLARLTFVLNMPVPDIKAKYEDQPNNWFIPIGDITLDESREHYDLLTSEPGITLRERPLRTYRTPAAAPHIIGTMGYIPPDQIDAWEALGYSGDEVVGRTGLEAWGEPYLAGQRGGELMIITSGGQLVTTLARREAIPARSIYTTFDYDFQRGVEDLLGERKGAVVVMDVSNGQVLALATWPRYDPNLFAEGIDARSWNKLVGDPNVPMMNRPVQGQYPPGSTFKIVTMGTLMERAGTPTTATYQCPGSWNELGRLMTCWLDHGHGEIDLVTALTASCDVAFYQIGYDLALLDLGVLPAYSRNFGLGAPTGLGQRVIPEGSGRLTDPSGLLDTWDPLGEASGLVPDDEWKRSVYNEPWTTGDNVNLSIGQGFLLTTPLQMCRLTAAVANGGTLHRPQIVQRIGGNNTEPELKFEADVVGRLPVTAGTLDAIKRGMEGATTSPRGTATHRFVGFPIAVAGKTGTAQNEGELPHAWFVGYLPAEEPEIAIVAMIENSGEGSQFAAPLFREVAALYYELEDNAPEVQGQGD
jgi:penicillin-binding protein 2